jgi:hypothetical protein
VDGLRAGLLRRGDDLVDDEIGLRGGRRADEDGFVGHIDGEAIGVGFGIDDRRLDAEAARGADDADGDFAAVGNQDFVEHWGGVSGVCAGSQTAHPLAGELSARASAMTEGAVCVWLADLPPPASLGPPPRAGEELGYAL